MDTLGSFTQAVATAENKSSSNWWDSFSDGFTGVKGGSIAETLGGVTQAWANNELMERLGLSKKEEPKGEDLTEEKQEVLSPVSPVIKFFKNPINAVATALGVVALFFILKGK